MFSYLVPTVAVAGMVDPVFLQLFLNLRLGRVETHVVVVIYLISQSQEILPYFGIPGLQFLSVRAPQ